MYFSLKTLKIFFNLQYLPKSLNPEAELFIRKIYIFKYFTKNVNCKYFQLLLVVSSRLVENSVTRFCAIIRSPIFPKVAQIVATKVFTSKVMFFKLAQNFDKYLGNIWKKNCHHGISKIYQCGRTGWKLLWNHFWQFGYFCGNSSCVKYGFVVCFPSLQWSP